MIDSHSHDLFIAANSKTQLNSADSNEIPITSLIEQYTPIASKSDLYMRYPFSLQLYFRIFLDFPNPHAAQTLCVLWYETLPHRLQRICVFF